MTRCIVPGCDSGEVKTAPPICFKHWRILPTRYKEEFAYGSLDAHQYKRLTKAAVRAIQLIVSNHGLENYPYYPKP